jgi:hypothetical protein
MHKKPGFLYCCNNQDFTQKPGFYIFKVGQINLEYLLTHLYYIFMLKSNHFDCVTGALVEM